MPKAPRQAEVLRPLPAPQIREYEVEEELVLYDPQKDVAHILNPTAAAVWWLCDGERTRQDISLHLARLYSMEPKMVVQDVEEILSGLCAAKLLNSS